MFLGCLLHCHCHWSFVLVCGIQLPRLDDDDGGLRLSSVGPLCLNGFDNIFALQDHSEDNMFAVKPLCLDCRDKKLRSVGVPPVVGHGQEIASIVLKGKGFVIKVSTIDTLPSSAIVMGKVPTLNHEMGN